MNAKAKTILVTGGGRGLGKLVAERLTREGHTVVATTRDSLNLASLTSVRRFIETNRTTFDVVMHVAGVLQQSPTRRLTEDGLEETLAVNTVAPWLLTRGLAPHLAPHGRVVCVSSRLHLPDSRGTPVRWEWGDINLERNYDPDRAYKNSKLALNWWAFELARRTPTERFTVHLICPGFVPETAWRAARGFNRWLLRYVLPLAPFATRADVAAERLAWVATAPELNERTGVFWADGKPFAASPQSMNQAEAGRFWSWLEKTTGVV